MSAIVISGASTGIGAATAERLSREGHVVFAGVRRDADAARLRALHENVRPIHLDVTDARSIAQAADEVASAGIELDGVVANAGIALGGPLEYLPIDVLRRQFDVNVFGAMAFVQAFLPHVKHPGGRIVLVGSIAGRLPMPYIGPYSASKAALRSLSDAFRIELAPAGIGIALIEPGSVKTPIWQKGRDSRAQIEALLGANPRPHYRKALEAVMATTEREEATGMPVERVVEAIEHALFSPKPRSNYVLGTPAKLGSIVAALPASVRSRIVRKSMRL